MSSDLDRNTPPMDSSPSYVRPRPQIPDIHAILGDTEAKNGYISWLWIFVFIVIVASGYGSYQVYKSDFIIIAPQQAYITAEVKRGAMSAVITATGAIEPTETVDISSELSGTVRKVLVDYNSIVKAGDSLLELDTDELKANILSVKAKIAAAQAEVAASDSNLESTKATMERTSKLVERDVAPRQELEDAEFAHAAARAVKQSAQALLAVANAELDLADLRLRKATIKSPINGLVLNRNVDVGQTVAASLEAPTLFVIAGNLAQMELRVDVDEADVGQVLSGQTATFTVEAFPGKHFPAEIKSIRYASEINSDVVTYKAVLSVNNDDMLLRQGMTATADILVSQNDDAILVPNAALRYAPEDDVEHVSTENDGRTVWLLRNGVPAATKIAIGASNGRYSEVLSGDLRVGDQLITETINKAQ